MIGALDTNPCLEAAGKEEGSPKIILRICWLSTRQPAIYPRRTALKAWGNDNASDFRIFDVRYLREQQSFSDCVQLERRKRFFPFQLCKRVSLLYQNTEGKI